MVEFYYHDGKDTPENFTDEHYSGVEVKPEDLESLGVLYFNVESQEELDNIASERNYKNRDEVSLSLKSFNNDIEAFNGKMKQFYEEHFHEDEEIRYIVDGEGYFDVRDKQDRWIRAKLVKNDMLILPAGIYHRFTLTSGLRSIKAVRLFKDEPKWEAINRSSGRDSSVRVSYLQAISV
ncbi:Piso0_000630 [Millerozyma farinosa CBS 7064]|uniref:Acireductone dioxygenase n=1 Tax=Pichia sorbitophila (strain ATCC MYA-4447 / BCRC 22081 / CBS 7064 / NBRC 10061 / NRRL Y-12695) TaxID=559304 RepID=G8YR31_PICSO|nr:Piso0_000630 [Millerozyma farinosa CBS 7064]